MSKFRILVTGFGIFPGVSKNPTAALIGNLRETPPSIPQGELQAVVLDTSYTRCEKQFSELFEDFKPHIYLAFGVKRSTETPLIETRARNRDDSKTADQSGEIRQDQIIIPGAPAAHQTCCSVSKIKKALEAHQISVDFSEDAGSYVCNHLYYIALHKIHKMQSKCRALFIHVPETSAIDGLKDLVLIAVNILMQELNIVNGMPKTDI